MLSLEQAMQERHSVRSYTDKPIPAEVQETLRQRIAQCNRETGLHIQLVTDEPKAFDGFMAHYGKFSGVRNYIAMIGKKGAALQETCGYAGEQLVLLAQQLGLNTCWVAMTYQKIRTAFQIDAGEKLCVVIALGYGTTQGVAHRSKSLQEVTQVTGEMPDWFRKGAEAALLAPTAMNQQKFVFARDGKSLTAKPGFGFYSKIDLGIAEYHFVQAAGSEQAKTLIP